MPTDVFEIDLSKVRIEDIDPNWQHTSGYTRAEVEAWMRQIGEIQRRCREDGATETALRALSKSRNLEERKLAETYDHFYVRPWRSANIEPNSIKVDWVDGHYEVTEGRHRLWAARQSGLTHIVARVEARDQKTLQWLREEGDRLAGQSRPWRQQPKLQDEGRTREQKRQRDRQR